MYVISKLCLRFSTIVRDTQFTLILFFCLFLTNVQSKRTTTAEPKDHLWSTDHSLRNADLDHLTLEGESKFSPGIFENHSPYDAASHTGTLECSITPLWKFWNCRFHPCCIMGVWTQWFTILFHSSEFALWQSLPERVGFTWKSVQRTWRNDCFFESERWKSKFWDIQTGTHIGISCLHHGTVI